MIFFIWLSKVSIGLHVPPLSYIPSNVYCYMYTYGYHKYTGMMVEAMTFRLMQNSTLDTQDPHPSIHPPIFPSIDLSIFPKQGGGGGYRGQRCWMQLLCSKWPVTSPNITFIIDDGTYQKNIQYVSTSALMWKACTCVYTEYSCIKLRAHLVLKASLLFFFWFVFAYCQNY